MPTALKTPTTDMEVTSIRLERELKEKLKELAENQGYQALIRDILWDYIHQKSNRTAQIARSEIRAYIPAIAQQEQRCVLTGRLLTPHENIYLGMTTSGDMVPLCRESLVG